MIFNLPNQMLKNRKRSSIERKKKKSIAYITTHISVEFFFNLSFSPEAAGIERRICGTEGEVSTTKLQTTYPV